MILLVQLLMRICICVALILRIELTLFKALLSKSSIIIIPLMLHCSIIELHLILPSMVSKKNKQILYIFTFLKHHNLLIFVMSTTAEEYLV